MIPSEPCFKQRIRLMISLTVIRSVDIETGYRVRRKRGKDLLASTEALAYRNLILHSAARKTYGKLRLFGILETFEILKSFMQIFNVFQKTPIKRLSKTTSKIIYGCILNFENPLFFAFVLRPS